MPTQLSHMPYSDPCAETRKERHAVVHPTMQVTVTKDPTKRTEYYNILIPRGSKQVDFHTAYHKVFPGECFTIYNSTLIVCQEFSAGECTNQKLIWLSEYVV